MVIGQNETQLIILTNSGTTAVTVSSITESVPGFSVSGVNLPLTLAAGQTVGLNVTFNPSAVGWVGGKVTFTSNANDQNLTFGIEGTGAQRLALTASPSLVSFGQVAVGSNSTLPLVLTNTANWSVTVRSFQAIGTGFSVSSPTVPYVLNPGKSITLNVTFAPQIAGSEWRKRSSSRSKSDRTVDRNGRDHRRTHHYAHRPELWKCGRGQ